MTPLGEAYSDSLAAPITQSGIPLEDQQYLREQVHRCISLALISEDSQDLEALNTLHNSKADLAYCLVILNLANKKEKTGQPKEAAALRELAELIDKCLLNQVSDKEISSAVANFRAPLPEQTAQTRRGKRAPSAPAAPDTMIDVFFDWFICQ